MVSDNFSNRLEILIKDNKTKKKDLAAAIELTPQAITEMTKGRGNPSFKTVKAIANYYHVNEQWLAYGTGEIMEPDEKYSVTGLYDKISPEEAEALRIMRECPEALSVVRMMGAVDADTQKDIQRIAETEKRTFEKLQQLRELKSA